MADYRAPSYLLFATKGVAASAMDTHGSSVSWPAVELGTIYCSGLGELALKKSLCRATSHQECSSAIASLTSVCFSQPRSTSLYPNLIFETSEGCENFDNEPLLNFVEVQTFLCRLQPCMENISSRFESLMTGDTMRKSHSSFLEGEAISMIGFSLATRIPRLGV